MGRLAVIGWAGTSAGATHPGPTSSRQALQSAEDPLGREHAQKDQPEQGPVPQRRATDQVRRRRLADARRARPQAPAGFGSRVQPSPGRAAPAGPDQDGGRGTRPDRRSPGWRRRLRLHRVAVERGHVEQELMDRRARVLEDLVRRGRRQLASIGGISELGNQSRCGSSNGCDSLSFGLRRRATTW